MKRFKFIDIALCFIIIITNLYVGTPLKYNIDIINIVINIVAIFYIGFSYIKNKENMKLNKIDICVILIALSTFIPLISNKYLRLRDTIYFIIKYISMLNLYFIVKKYVKEDKKRIKIITNTVIIMSIILIIFGMDLLTSSVFEKIYEFFKMSVVYDESTYSMSSLFKYPNAFAMFINFTLFLALGSYLNETENKKLKIAYGMCIFFQMFAVLTSYSRMSLMFQIGLIIVFWFLAKEKRKEIFKLAVISEISAFIFFMLFTKFRFSGNYFIIILCLIFVAILNYLLLFKIKINNKKTLLIAIPIIAFVVIVAIIILSPKTLVLFNGVNAKDSFRKQNIEVEPNSNYCVQIDLKSISDVEKNFVIYIKETDVTEKISEETFIELDNFDGIKEFNIKTQDFTKNISIIFRCYNLSENTEMEIRNVFVNGKKINVHYGLIPVEFVNKLQKIGVKSTSVQARIDYIQEALEIASTNLLFGYGGNAWRFYPKTLEIEDSIAEHSYPMQILVQFGIFGLMAYIILIIFLAIKVFKYLKTKDKNYLTIGIILAIFLIVVHSIVDFEMSFFNVLLTFYSYIAILSTILHEDNRKINYKWMYLFEIILLVFLYINIGGIVAYNIKTDDIADKQEKLKLVNVQIALAPYDHSYKTDKVNCLTSLKNGNIYEKNSEQYYNACKNIIKQERFIIEKEKKKDEVNYRTLVYNIIDLITEENQEEILQELTAVLNDKDIPNKEGVIKGIKSRLTRTLNNETTQQFINEITLLNK